MIRAATLAAACALLAACTATPAPTGRSYPTACPPGEVIVHGQDPTPCDLHGGGYNTLTVLDITPDECDDLGGTTLDAACIDTDF